VDGVAELAMGVFVNSFFEERVERLFDLAWLVDKIFGAAGLEYRVVGGLATYLYVEESQSDAGRLTKDIDVAIRREDLPAIAKAAAQFGLEYRHAAGLDMLVEANAPSSRRAVQLIFAGEKVRQEYPHATPELGTAQIVQGIRLMRIEDLIRMKLTSFRLKDRLHLKDLDEAGLVMPEMAGGLPQILGERLAAVRSEE
jgi:hypothetical protein